MTKTNLWLTLSKIWKAIYDFFTGAKHKDKPIPRIEYPDYSVTSFDIEIVTRVNDFRDTMGLPRLSILADVSSIAYSHSKYMAETDVALPMGERVSHDNFPERGEQIQVRYGKNTSVGENTAGNFQAPMGFVDRWISSPGHYKNIIGNFTHTGVGTCRDKNGKMFATQLFVRL